MSLWKVDAVCRYWNGSAYHIGLYQRTIERGRKQGWHVLRVRRWSPEAQEFVPKEVKVRPDYVKPL